MSKKIELTQGKFAIVDDEDYPYLSRFHWTIGRKKEGKYYEASRGFLVAGKTVSIPMWKFVVASENNKKACYKNKNGLDCRKENIVIVPAYMANHFSIKKKNGYWGRKPSSQYKGVSYASTYAGHKKWVTFISRKGVVFTKHFLTEKEAAEAYNEKAKEIYGDIAYQNKIEN